MSPEKSGLPALTVTESVGNDAYIGACDHVFWSNDAPHESPHFRYGDVVFCKIDEVWRLFRALRRTRKRIVLVTSEGDKPVTPELHAQRPPHVFHWFGTNMFADGPDTTPLPLGLGRADAPATLDLDEIKSAASCAPPRDKLLYANFGTASNPGVREPLQAWLNDPAQSWITREPHGAANRVSYLQNLFAHRFVLCPPGNGEDTHRMWEVLYCGAIPVVRESPAMRHFKKLPVLFVTRLEDLTAQLLNNFFAARDLAGFSERQLDVNYWSAEFNARKDMVAKLGPVSHTEFLRGWTEEIGRVTGLGK